MSVAASARSLLLERVTAPPWGLAVAAMDGPDLEVGLHPGCDPLTETSLFDVGSVMKTVTGLLLAEAVVRGELTLRTTVGELLDSAAGVAASVTLVELATHRSGLPRLPPNLLALITDEAQPWENFTADHLSEALETTPRRSDGRFEYSNFGFMLLGRLLATAAGASFAELVADRVFAPLGLRHSRCPSPLAGETTMPGYVRGQQLQVTRRPLPGAGGFITCISDLATYLRAYISATDHALTEAMALATTIHTTDEPAYGLAWGHVGGGWVHDGATAAGFQAVVGFYRPTASAVALIANGSTATMIGDVALEVLTALARRDL
jgi:D-alanyl-D-alanine-carboxypeptidase/D-alanyl-D-alanine-endopeptidase